MVRGRDPHADSLPTAYHQIKRSTTGPGRPGHCIFLRRWAAGTSRAWIAGRYSDTAAGQYHYYGGRLGAPYREPRNLQKARECAGRFSLLTTYGCPQRPGRGHTADSVRYGTDAAITKKGNSHATKKMH